MPAGTQQLGAAPAGQVLDLDVVLAGQNPSGLDQAVAAVSTPGSPQYRHYLTPAQYAATYGPDPSEVARVSATLRSEGLTVGSPDPGSTLLPVRGSASVVSAALGTPLVLVQAPGDTDHAIVNTASPQVPAALGGAVTGVIGLDGLFQEQAMVRRAPPATTLGPESIAPPVAPTPVPNATPHAPSPQACPAAQQVASDGIYTSTQMSSIFGLDQLFAQGRTGLGQSIAVVEFERYAQSDFATFASCYGLSNPIRNVAVDGGSGGPPSGSAGEAALDVELAAVNAPSASLVVYEAPNGNEAQALDLFNRIASDDSSQVVTTSWGVCEQDMPAGDRQTENGIFQRMALQGQTVIAASGDSGSEDCLPTDGSKGLAVDDPGSQPDVVSAGGTSLASASAASQTVWNCQFLCRSPGAGGGGYSIEWPANPGQPAASGPGTAPCGLSACRAVPDFSYPSDPTAGAVVDYWNGAWGGAGGTSVAAPVNAGFFVDTNQGCYPRWGASVPRSTPRTRATARRSPTSRRSTTTSPTRTPAASPPPPASMRPAASAHPSTRILLWRSKAPTVALRWTR